jgi:hypothetical protein
MDQHPIAVDILDLEVANFGCSQPRTITDAKSRAIFEPGTGNGGHQVSHLLDA